MRAHTIHTGSDWDTSITMATPGTPKNIGAWTFNENEALGIFSNGMFEPTVTGVKANEAVTLRILSATGGETYKLKLSGGCTQMFIIAWDGVYLTAPQLKTQDDTVYLQPGSRVDVQVKCSGNGELTSITQYASPKIVKIETSDSGGVFPFATAAELAAITRPYYLEDLQKNTVDVKYDIHSSQMGRPRSSCGGAALFWWGSGKDCSGMKPWGADQPSASSVDCPFSFFGGRRGNDPLPYLAQNKLVTYIGNGKTDGEVNEWRLYGQQGRGNHPLHLHVHHFQVVKYECAPGSTTCSETGKDDSIDKWLQIGEWRDILPTFEGRITVRFRATDFPGETMMHCHFLRHEDLGMMDSILVMAGYRSRLDSSTARVSASLSVTVMSAVVVAAACVCVFLHHV